MITQKLHCNSCGQSLVPITASDFLASSLGFQTVDVDSLKPLFRFLRLNVCASCGLVVFYANPTLQSLTQELSEETGGHS
jgi:hypothetical protein